MLTNSKSDSHAGSTFEAIEGVHLSIGRLLTPHEFQADVLRTRQRPLVDAWAIATRMPDVDMRQLESKLVPRAYAQGLLTSERGVVYPVVIFQAAGLQVRVLLSLADAKTKEWFRASCEEACVRLAVEVPETQQLAVVSVPYEAKSQQQVDHIVGNCASLDRAEALVDAAHVLRQVAERSAFPSVVTGFETREVRVICTLGLPSGLPAESVEQQERVLN